MNNKIISKSERSITNTIIIFIGIILFTFFIFLINNNFQPKNVYEENLKIIGFLVLTLIILYCIYYLLNQKRIFVYDKYFEIKMLLKTRKYHFSEITTHYSEYFEGKYNSWTEYYLILNTGEKITLIDKEYSNFDSFYSSIKQRVKLNKELNTSLTLRKGLKYSIISVLLGFLFIYTASCFYDFKKIDNGDFVYFESKLKNDVSLLKGSKGRKYFEFELTEYPNFNFKISGSFYDGISDNDEFIKTFKKDVIITIGIEKDDFEKKISKKKGLNILDKYINFSKIQVKQIKNNQNQYYIDLSDVNSFKIQNNYIGFFFFSLIGLVFFYLTIVNYNAYIKSIKQITNKNHT